MEFYSTEGLLPPACCFDPRWHELGKKLVYDRAPIYIGHVSMVPEDGTYAVAQDGKDGRLVLTREHGVIRCFDLRCRHQGAMLIDPSATPEYTSSTEFGSPETLQKDPVAGKKKCLVCPIHQWTYTLDGALRGAPNFDIAQLPEDRRRLHEVPIRVWNGMIFANVCKDTPLPWEAEVADYPFAELFDLSEYELGGSSSSVYACSMHVFNKVYFDDRHVPLGHKTSFGAVMDLSVLRFIEYPTWNVQEVGFVMKPATRLCPEYRAWHEWVLRLSEGVQPKFGALWTFFYPNFMIEWYPWTVVVSIMDPVAVDRSENRCYFFYPRSLTDMVARGELTQADLDAFKRAQQAAYGRTAAEDEDFVMRIAKGLRFAYEEGEPFVGVPHPVEERGIFCYDRFFQRVQTLYDETSAE